MIRFTGDICLSDNDFDSGFGVGSTIIKGRNPFSDILKREGDIWVGNLECVLSDTTIRTGYNKSCFRLTPNAYTSDRLIDCYCVANNHIMQHGADAYKETLDTLRNSGKEYVGSKERKTVVLCDEGKKIAVSSFSLRCDNTGFEPCYWYAPEPDELKDECEKYKEADYRVAYIHWGIEFVPYPYAEQQKLAHYLIDIGFDMVVGHHPHVIQGFEVYKGKHIFYSLGNFVFNMAYPAANIGLVVSFDPRSAEVSMDYVRIGDGFRPAIVDESVVPDSMRMDYINGKIGLFPNLEQYNVASQAYLRKYRKSHHAYIARSIFRYKLSFLKGMILNFLHERMS